jgi:hypothetical protein
MGQAFAARLAFATWGFATACAAAGDPPMAAPDAAATLDAGIIPDAAATADAGSDVATGRCDPRDAGPSEEFRKIYQTILRPTCGGAGRFCHANELNSTKLDFNTLEQAYANLVNVPTALTCASAQGWLRVVPFDPRASAVMHVKGDFCAYRHGSHGALWPVDLSPIEAWILGGAR